MSEIIRRQEHGIKAKSLSITLPGAEMDRLRKEAESQGITASRHIVNLIRRAQLADALAGQPLPEREPEAVVV